MDTPPATTWWNAALATFTTIWQAFLVPGALGVWVVYKFRAGRQDTEQVRQDAREKAEADDLERMRANMDARTLARMDRLETENAELRTEVNRLVGLLRAWFGLAHDVWHAWAQQWQVASWMAERAGLAPLSEARNPRRLSRDLDRPGYEADGTPAGPPRE